MSGLSTGVLVVEAAKKSGSLITANYAIEQGRDVFAIPGSIYSPLSRGTHHLIKQGAKLVENLQDILDELGSTVAWALETVDVSIDSADQASILDAEQEQLLDIMGYNLISIDELVKSSGLTPDAVSSMLLVLELDGIVESRHGGQYIRCAQR